MEFVNRHKFKSLTIEIFDEIKESFEGKMPTADPDWWKEKTDFGLHLLKELWIESTHIVENFPEMDDWKSYHRILKQWFITKEEYEDIKNNVLFLHGKRNRVHEDGWFISYTLIRKGGFNWEELKDMSYRGYMIFYYYTILDNISDNAEAFASLIMKPEESKNGERIYG